MTHPTVGAALLLLLLCTPTPHAGAQAATTGDSGERVHRLFAEFDAHAPGVAVAVVKDGEVVFAGGYGSGNLEYGVPITHTSVFSLGSVSKQFTGFALAILIDDGKLSLDDPVRRYVPELPEYDAPLLVRHLVYHTAGLRNFLALAHLGGRSGSDLITHQDALSLVLSQRETNSVPGAAFQYSNEGYVLLATIVERVSGRSFPEFMRDEVFEPLGMTSTFVLDDHERVIRDRVQGYKRTSAGELLKVVAPLTVNGGTGVYSSAEDVARWLATLADPPVGKERVVDIMHRTDSLRPGEPLNYAFGLDFAEHRGLRVVGHAGEFVGIRAYAGRLPQRDLGVVVLSNGPDSPDPFQTFLRVLDVYLEEEGFSRPDGASNPQGTAALAGAYVSESGVPVRVLADGEMLEASVAGGPSRVLTPVGNSVFYGITHWGAGFQITFGPGDATLSLYGTSRLQKTDAHADAARRWTPGPEVLAEYEGFYYSPELGVTYTIAVENDVLVARGPRVEVDLRPEEMDVFEGNLWFFGGARFERDEEGTISGLRASGFRLSGLLFERRDPT